MTRRFLLTMSSTAWLIGLYCLYARFITPWLEPAEQTSRQAQVVPVETDPAEFSTGVQRNLAERFLPDQDWAKIAENQFCFGDLYIYTNLVEENSEKGEIKFSPFAMIWKNPHGDPDEPPLRVTADSAVIRFRSLKDDGTEPSPDGTRQATFSLTSPQASRPVFGSLEGDVRIDGPNGLVIVGRTFTFSEDALRLWSDSDILFHYGPHQGTGHGFQVDFLPGSGPSLKADQPRLGGLRTVTLLREVALVLKGEERSPNQARRSPLKKGDQMQIRSDGRLQYDLEAGLMTFDQNVRVNHPTAQGKDDTIQCDLMTLVLNSSLKATAPESQSNPEIRLTANEQMETGTKPMQNWLPKNLSIEKLLADGSGKQRVEMISPSRSLHGNASQVEYDFVRRNLVLRDPAAVDVRQGAHEIHVPEIQITFSESRQEVQSAVAQGAGTAMTRLDDGRLATARWKQQLIKSTEPKSGLDIVEMQGDASISLESEYHLQGDALRAWFTPVSAKPKDPQNPPKAPQVQRLAGVGLVKLKSPQALVSTNWLDVQIRSMAIPPELKNQRIEAPGPRTRGVGARNARGRRLPEPSAPPIQLVAESIQAQVARDIIETNRVAVLDFWAEGKVNATQPSHKNRPSVGMQGNWVHVKNFPESEQLVELTGAPARVLSGDSKLEGPDIQLDRPGNTLTVTGPGRIRYPVKVSLEGNPLNKAQTIEVSWQECLKFDGQTARFFEKVTASLQQTTMRCNAMQVSLLKPIRFDEHGLEGLSEEKLQLARVFCENKVEVESSTYRNNMVESRSFGRLGQFVIDNITGKTNALGPGHFVEWRRTKSASDARAALKTGKRSSLTPPPSKWTYSRIDFYGRMKGNLRERFTTFEEHVEIVYGPVSNVTEKLDPDKLPDGSAGMTCNALKVEQFAETASSPAFVKLSAEGNTKLELAWDGQPWHAQADEVKFDESKDYYLLRSNGNRKVVINRQPTTEDPRGHIICSGVDIFRTRREFKFYKATELNGLQQ